MTVQTYVQEDGSGAFQAFHVPDLIPSASTSIEILIILESPHADELDQGHPVSGQAGTDALRFLRYPRSTSQALGPFVDSLHGRGDGRVAIMNVSEVPLQVKAFARHVSTPVLSAADWDLLERVRTRRAQRVDTSRDAATHDASALLLPGFRSRVDVLRFAAGAIVVPAGAFAQRYWNSLAVVPLVTVLPVLHPSRRLWDRASAQNLQNLLELRERFAEHTA